MTALGQILLSCHDSLYRYARALSRDPAAAEELVQETYRRALGARRLPDPLVPASVRAWAFTILRHIWHNSLRSRQHELSREEAAQELADPAESVEVLLSRQLLRSEIVQAIDSLPAPFREVILLREIEGLAYAEIARVVGCPEGTVMSRLARARASLRRLLIRFAPSVAEIGR